ncbi:hypothetical protein [Tepidibacillus marianensis]|uniref:hypothetical protein n=1 Tax=Tepidibacillus marianensis TaxID=3131995 RepID=UPI0030D47322
MSVDGKKVQFIYDDRLGIHIPDFKVDWVDLSLIEQMQVIDQWEKQRSKIPDRVKELEEKIMEKQDKMFEIPFEEYVELHKEIIDMSSAINDLNIWFRTHGQFT